MSNIFLEDDKNCIDLEEKIYEQTEETLLLYECVKKLYGCLDVEIFSNKNDTNNNDDKKEKVKSL